MFFHSWARIGHVAVAALVTLLRAGPALLGTGAASTFTSCVVR
jgi:hypothetical protein